MKDPDYEGIIDRIKPVVAALFANDRDMMVNHLVDNRLVSSTIVDKWLDALTKSERKKYRL
jgi:CMP-2-keto-3-deoxyoctulosonic acid synthetase